MWSNTNNSRNNNNNSNNDARYFSTPPASWRLPPASAAVMPMSDRKRVSPGTKRDIFHVIHKVPAGDSPYVRAKHVQLIEKDPSRAVSLFWAAINAGDRVDSALKDMAVVMKQLNRSEEAIEAIKSFRHLCPYDSQESIDNVLVELYKRSGRIEEEIATLQRKLRNIEEGITFGGKKAKTSRSQGRKILLTVEKEKSRLLGNLGWAYLQQHNYGLAEQHYRKALSLESDKNKECNLAICLIHMNRISEAKSILQAVRDSCGNKQMDDSFAKSFERAWEILNEIEPVAGVISTEQEKNSLSLALPTPTKMQEVTSSNYPASFLYTQPRSFHLWSGNKEEQTMVRRRMVTVEQPTENVPQRAVRNLYGELRDSTNESSEATPQKFESSVPSPCGSDWRKRSWQEVRTPEPVSQLQKEQHRMRASWGYDEYEHLVKGSEVTKSNSQYSSQILNAEGNANKRKSTRDGDTAPKFPTEPIIVLEQDQNYLEYLKSADEFGGTCLGKESSTKSIKKSWADIVEEEEKATEGQCFDGWRSCQEESNDENLNSNLCFQDSSPSSLVENLSQKLGEVNLRGGHFVSGNSTARRSLCFEGGKDATGTKRRNRLQVFRDITPTPDSP